MHFFDPARPRLASDVPAYLAPSGRPLGPLGALYVTPREGGGYEVGQHWLTGRNSASWLAVEVGGDMELLRLLARWRDDPEATMREVFGWSYSDAAPALVEAPAKSPASLEEMGL